MTAILTESKGLPARRPEVAVKHSAFGNSIFPILELVHYVPETDHR